MWDPATGEPLHRAIVWQDRRTADRCAELRAAGHEPLVRAHTGLVLDPYFSATKIEWLLREVDGLAERARDGRAVFGTIDSWLVWNLTREHATDPSNASRTMLYDLRTGDWAEDLCELFGVPVRALPDVRPSMGTLGHHDGRRAPGARRRARRGRRGRPAGRALRAGVPGPGDGEEHLRHGVVRARQHRRPGPGGAARAARDGRLGDRRAALLRPGGGDLRHRRRDPVAARRARR